MTQSQDTGPFDPFATWNSMRDSYLDVWSKTMIDMVNSDEYARATGMMLDNWLTASAPFRKVVESTMNQVLGQLNMPTRSDVVSLAERMTNIEMRLDDMDAKLDTLQRELRSAPAAGASRPSTRRSAAKEE
ncbi:MAG TPA: hypothetical protein VKX16_15460 [Chloroflexota bacterium]|nr:hypothetical protein [Chloroflexota bacterium]